ncbi:NAD(P)-dependent oxidoreductase [Gluconobacter wancherniae]|uniref:Dihydropyrimidine dehydrogenase subunit A n=1 Tax=Gluconobacter wancherniae NBRC 103581 TaxID=656744 RepID=A0A511AWZ9_9PROT|nr:NAD(P)-dependent oxidoreductase [Gluconobacter wancherniae]MBF0852914.1 NAD(P)-dependent oxidoreductase [Gluconobacter wancherniae]MBS1061741.1 NAD(P)-dependent oxidoreductase [Gluconobacter wancherniae]MBS1087801.1 NAD(P)-dependent oxidoreductase [Gluconobacter wancherniae]GBD56370.1 dihydropyrimidine dehydrogenase subunit A [Gluconobacter wancherniae NBRC 103581]GBR63741.1 glutamate synthase small subunit [Gluconobacter wancherniae NBRC 103581]
MAERMLQFVTQPQVQPEKRGADERRHDFGEIYKGFVRTRAEEQASRCSQCGIPFCSVHCPLGNNIPDWLKLTAEDRLQEAYEMSSATNTFPEICGRICPQDRLCEGNCVIEKGFESVTIGAVERFITENAFEQGWVKPSMPERELGRSVGIVGAGPAGLACAERLRALGYEVHVYDRHDRVGGLMVYGIPSFKLEKTVIARRHALLEQQGIVFHLSTPIGAADGETSLDELRNRHEAVFLGTGVYRSREVQVPGAGLNGVVDAIDFLTASNRRGYDEDPGEDLALHAKGRRVVVIGGGDTAMDCVRTSIRQGAENVVCVYRRDRENMPGSRQEVGNAEEEGVKFEWLAAPEAFVGDQKVGGVRVQKMRLGAPDATGRRSIEATGQHSVVEGDLVIRALGFDPEDLPALWQQPDLAVTRWGTLKVAPGGFETSLEGVFAGGDIVRGASLVVWAIRDGRDAAESIHHYMTQTAAAEAAE